MGVLSRGYGSIRGIYTGKGYSLRVGSRWGISARARLGVSKGVIMVKLADLVNFGV